MSLSTFCEEKCGKFGITIYKTGTEPLHYTLNGMISLTSLKCQKEDTRI